MHPDTSIVAKQSFFLLERAVPPAGIADRLADPFPALSALTKCINGLSLPAQRMNPHRLTDRPENG
jgi:hypothetical protein